MTRSSTLGRLAKILIGIVLGSLISFLALTWWALEAGGVAIVETEAKDGSTRSTHVWFAMPEGEIWIEAGTPGNGWYVDIQDQAMLSLTMSTTSTTSGTSAPSVTRRYRAEPIPGEAPHHKIRSLLREKYGFRDWWIATLFDTSQSIAVRLIPVSSTPLTPPTSPTRPELPTPIHAPKSTSFQVPNTD